MTSRNPGSCWAVLHAPAAAVGSHAWLGGPCSRPGLAQSADYAPLARPEHVVTHLRYAVKAKSALGAIERWTRPSTVTFWSQSPT